MINKHDNFNQSFIRVNTKNSFLVSSEYHDYINFEIKDKKLYIEIKKEFINIDLKDKDEVFVNVKINDFVIIIIRTINIDLFYDTKGFNYLKVPRINSLKDIACFDKYDLVNKQTTIIIYSIEQVIINLNNRSGLVESIEYDKMIYKECHDIKICLYPDELPLFCYRPLTQSNEFTCIHIILKLFDNTFKASRFNQLIEYLEYDNDELIYNSINPFLYSSTNNLTFNIDIYKVLRKENNIIKLNKFLSINNSYFGQHYSVGLFVLKHRSLVFYYLFNSINNIGSLFNSDNKLLVSNIIIDKCYIENNDIIFIGLNNKFIIKL